MKPRVQQEERPFQAANKRVAEQTAQLLVSGFPADFRLELVCECADEACFAVIEVTHEAYAQILKQLHTFVVKPGHYTPADELVVNKLAEYWVVATKPGKSALIEP
jgi:hypothetical protein